MKVVVFRVSQPPTVEDVPDTLAAMQEIVGGDIEGHSILMQDVLLICNANGKATCKANKYIPLLSDVVHGDFLVTAHTFDGAGRDLSDAEVRSAISIVDGEAFPYSGARVAVV